MLRYLSAGESHGPALTAIVEGMPAGVFLDTDLINLLLKRRQGGYGRGKRMEIEKDKVEFLSGVRNGITLGSPITLQIRNKDWQNWQDSMSPYPGAKVEDKVVTKPRPGHADLPGAIKYHQRDMRNILERASARETALRTAVGGLAKCFLEQFAIWTLAHVVRIGDVEVKEVDYHALSPAVYDSPLYCSDRKLSGKMVEVIDKAKRAGDSIGGIFEVVIGGLPVGLGSHVQWDRRLDGRLAGALMSIPAIKGVEIGMGFKAAALPGSKVHDQIYYSENRGFYRTTNNAGGLEGGIANGEILTIRAAMKPIPTLYSPLLSVDFISKEAFEASVERSDTCAVPAASVVGECVAAWEIARAFLEKFGGDHLDEVKESFNSYQEYVKSI
ncbi:MAG: chorismate synthase [Bacillota bacterium]